MNLTKCDGGTQKTQRRLCRGGKIASTKLLIIVCFNFKSSFFITASAPILNRLIGLLQLKQMHLNFLV